MPIFLWKRGNGLPAGMASYKISVRARAQVIEIYRYSAETFRVYQAEAYHSSLERTFALLADFPRIGRLVEELAAKHRRFRFQAHYVFYTEETGHILIRAIYHHARNIKPALFR